MANPRKFSEKIALHTQKQAEETAAFEAILQEVNNATRDPPRYQKQHQQQQPQHIAPNLGSYRAGSLPNVNQIKANQALDLKATLQHLDDMTQGRSNAHGNRGQRQLGAHRRNFHPDKRIDSSPYGSVYHLSPPPDTSWRRVHSDPSLHVNAMGNAANKTCPPVTPPSHRRIVEMVGENAGDSLQMNYWDQKKQLGPSRPKSCEVPNINIYPSQEHETNNSPQSATAIPMNTCNTGSLPDLSVLQFPSPMVTPLDQEDPYNTASANHSPVNLSPTSPRHMAPGMAHQNPQSPGQRRRQAGVGSLPSPLVLNQMGGPPSPAGMADMDPCMQQQYLLCLQQQQQLLQQQQQQQQQMRLRGTPPAPPYPNSSPQAPPSYPNPSPLYSPTQSLNHHRQTTKPSLHNNHRHVSSPVGSPTHSTQLPQNQSHLQQTFSSPSQSQQQHPHTSQHHRQQSPLSPPVPQVRITNCDESITQQSMTQYRNNGVSETSCQSPTSPNSAPSYSPSQSPVLNQTSQPVNSNIGDPYYIQQQQQQQTNALQHQFEQFNMNHPPGDATTNSSNIMTSNGMSLANSSSGSNVYSMAFSQQPGLALQYTQAAMLGLTSSDDLFQPHFLGPIDVMASGQSGNHISSSNRSLSHNNIISPGSKIPDIVLTGADDMYRLPLDFAKDLGNAITGMPECFDTDFLTNDEAFKAGLDPLDLEEIQMLTDASLVADPAVEDTFKLDRL